MTKDDAQVRNFVRETHGCVDQIETRIGDLVSESCLSERLHVFNEKGVFHRLNDVMPFPHIAVADAQE